MMLLASCMIGYLATWAITDLVVSTLPRSASRRVLHVGLAVATWLGLESCSRFAWLIWISYDTGPNFEIEARSNSVNAFAILRMVAFFFVAVAAAVLRHRQPRIPAEVGIESKRRMQSALLAAFAVVLAVASVGFVYSIMIQPSGGDDALSIWNLHARFLYAGGTDWERAFLIARNDNVPVAWHLDYPLGLPAVVSSGWSEWGGAARWISGAVAGMFIAGAVAVTVGAVGVMRGLNQALLAGVALLGAVGYVNTAASQYADAPLSLYIVSALVCLTLAGRSDDATSIPDSGRWFALCGWFTALAAWTKNEGLLFAVCLGLVAAVSLFRTRGLRGALRGLAIIVAGAAPAAACLIYFKWNLAASNDLMVGQSSEATLARLTDPARYGQIAQAMISHYFKLGKLVAVAVPVYWIGTGNCQDAAARRARIFFGVTLAMLLAGYFAVYLTTPRDLAWHLSSSMTRLAAQLWPALVALVFLASRSLDGNQDPAARPPTTS